jgi:hypothetical protein
MKKTGVCLKACAFCIKFSKVEKKGVISMVKVKTFTMPLKIFETVRELEALDEQVNSFISQKGGKKIISTSDACTTDANGGTIGIIRVVAYEEV